jgi:hypothetical protein
MKNIITNIDFADSEYKSMEMSSGNLVVLLNSWDEMSISIKFIDVIQFMYKLGDGISGIYEDVNIDNMLNEALSRCYTEMPADHPYKHYKINDLQDFSFIEVIASEVSVSKIWPLENGAWHLAGQEISPNAKPRL